MPKQQVVGWIGAGKMGTAMVERLVDAGRDVVVWNRTASRVEPLTKRGARAASGLSEVLAASVVFSMLADDGALHALLNDEAIAQLGSSAESPARIWVDCSTISLEASAAAASALQARGYDYVSAPVSGNPEVVRSGNVIFAVSGSLSSFEALQPLFSAIGRAAHYVGDGHQARIVKLCTNLLLAVTAQTLAEIVVLGERSGVTRRALTEFINDSAVGSAFTAYKGKAFVDLDFTPTFTPEGQRKDIRLGLAQAASLEVPLPLVAATEVIFSRLIASGLGEGKDFGALLLQVAQDAGIQLGEEHS